MGNSFKQPLTPAIDNPVNIDRVIQSLQEALQELPWLEKCFARAYESRKMVPGKYGIGEVIAIYPEVWQGPGQDLLEAMPNDNLASMAFFKVEEPQTVIDYVQDQYSIMQSPVSIICWFNLDKVSPNADYRIIELLKGQFQRCITTALMADSIDGITINRIWDTPDNVYKGYTIDAERNQELIHPYGGFRFECTAIYQENCPDSKYDLP